MRSKIWRILGGALIGGSLLFPVSTFAASGTGYQPGGNTTVNVPSPVGLPNLGTGGLTFNLQEGLYSTTGLSAPHDYVWIDVNGTPVLAVDPLCTYEW